MTCGHCKRIRAVRRLLCWTCRQKPEVRALYPSSSKFGRRGVGHAKAGEPLAPTDTAPGSEERIAVLSERAAAGVALWHPEDVRIVTGHVCQDGPRVYRVVREG